MSLTAAAIRMLAEKGLSAADIADVAEAMEPARTSNAVRQARYRDRKRNERNVTSNVTNPPIEDIHTPKSDISPDGESQTERDVRAVQQIWNDMAKANGLAACSRIAGKRLTACKARLRNDGLDAIRMAIEHIPKSSFLLGRSGNWNGATINFLLKPDSVTKILEGQYDDRTKQCQAPRVGNDQGDRRSSLARAIDEGLANF